VPKDTGTVAVNVKVRRSARATAKRVLSKPGVIECVPTFPDEKDDELSRLYVLSVDRSKLPSVLRTLRADPGVEYAERAAARRPVR
jgi:hypothetical protein